jgi:hypothetical protein
MNSHVYGIVMICTIERELKWVRLSPVSHHSVLLRHTCFRISKRLPVGIVDTEVQVLFVLKLLVLRCLLYVLNSTWTGTGWIEPEETGRRLNNLAL